MLDLERVKRDDRLLRALTGLNLKALTALRPSFAQALAEAPIPRRSQQPRERSVGGARSRLGRTTGATETEAEPHA